MKMFFEIAKHIVFNHAMTSMQIVSDNVMESGENVKPATFVDKMDALASCFNFRGNPILLDLRASNLARVKIVFLSPDKEESVRIGVSYYSFNGCDESKYFSVNEIDKALNFLDAVLNAPCRCFYVKKDDIVPALEKIYARKDSIKKIVYTSNENEPLPVSYSSDDFEFSEVVEKAANEPSKFDSVTFTAHNGISCTFNYDSRSEVSAYDLDLLDEAIVAVITSSLGVI